MEYRLLLVRVFVRDLARAVDFYTRVLGMPLSFRSDEMGWAQLAHLRDPDGNVLTLVGSPT